MLQISPEKIAHVIVRARELDAKVAPWDSADDRPDSDAILESLSGDATEQELRAFIRGLNVDEQASLVAVMWIGRETFGPDELDEAIETARSEASAPTADYLLGVPLLADYLEDGLDALGIPVEDAEDGVL
ncbi:MAG: DUF3775 domain-containing protein [Defluviimonas sp.]|nr:DUF3775 domain-containing protein [Defluviimonas sp.]